MPVPLDPSDRTLINARGRRMRACVSASMHPASMRGFGFDREKPRSQPRGRYVRFARNGILGCVIAFGGSVLLPSEGRAIDPQYHDEFVVDGVARSLKSWWQAYRDCERNSEVEQGEYETREEFEARRAELARNCETMWPLTNAVATKPVSLSYDADSETFSFTVDLGNTGRPAGVWDLGFISTRDEPEYWQRMCDADVACKRGDNYYYKIVCWVVDPKWLEDFRVSTSANMEVVDAEPRITVWQNTNENLWATERAARTCNSNGDWRLEIKVQANIQKARKMKTIEPSLRLEFSGRSETHYTEAGFNHRSYWIFHISGIRLVNQEDGSEIFALKR